MVSVALLALVASAATVQAPTARVFLKAPAATAPACRTTRVNGQLVQASLFSSESERCPVARIGDEQITLGELAESLELEHLSRSPRAAASAKRPDMNFTPALQRLIDARLLVLEAREMGLADDPKFRTDVQSFRESRLRAAVQRIATAGVKPDPAEVQRLYADAVREWKLASVLLEKEDAAKAFAAALEAGQPFDALAKKYVSEKKARGGGPAEWAGAPHMIPEILASVRTAKPGVPVGPIRIQAGWVMLRVDGTRLPKKEDRMARNAARASSVARREHEAVRRFYLGLVAKYARVDEALLKHLDLEAKGASGFAELLKDPRPLVTISGEKPITVADLTREVSMKFFHGIESPIREKRVNREKDAAFEKVLGSRLLVKEALARGLDREPSLRREVQEYERALAFSTFTDRVIVPDVKVTEADAIAYYEKHKREYTAPQMYKLDGFAFPTAGEAQAALDKLKAGTDFGWLRSAAPGQVPPEKRSLQFDGRTVSAATLPPGLAKALTGTREGDYRLYSAREGEVYVVRVVDQAAPAAEPYADARESIAKKLFDDRLTGALHDYAARLRKAQRVDVLITRIAM